MAQDKKVEKSRLISKDDMINSKYVAPSYELKNTETDAAAISRDTTSRPSENIKWKKAYSVFLCFAFFIFGWVYGQMGPAILDLQENTNVSFTLASVYMMSVNIGHLVGSLGGGVLSGKINTYLLLFVSISGVAVAVAVIPWCFSFTPMLIAHIMQGVFGGCLDAGAIAEMLAVWRYDARWPMQALYFSFAFAAILSPLSVSSFSKVVKNDDYLLNSTTHAVPLHENASLDLHNNGTEHFLLYIPYSISAGLSVLAALPFLFVFLKSVSGGFKIYDVQEDTTDPKPISTVIRTFAVVGILYAFSIALEESTGQYLTVFCVSHLRWTKQNGARATSLFHGSFAIGRFVGIVEAIYIKPHKLLTCYTFLMVIACTAFLISAIFMCDVGIWVCSSLIGIALSVISPSTFTMTEDNFFPVTGKIASYFVVTDCTGSSMNTFFIGYLINEFGGLSLAYVLLSESIIIFSLALAVLYVIYKFES